MKRLLLPVLLAFSSASGNYLMAQPTLTTASNNLKVGDQFTGHQATITPTQFTAAATAGANQTWNFNTLVSTAVVQAGVLSRAAAPNPTSMPAATMVVKVGDQYAYYENNGTSLKEHGAYEATQNYSLENTDPAEKLRFPFTFNSFFQDNYSGSANLGGTIVPRVGVVTVTAESYGTLTTPSGTYQNVLKVKTEESSNPGTPFAENSITYDWFQPGIHFPVLRITRRITMLGTAHTGFYLTQPLGTKEDLAARFNLQVWPNPANSGLTIQLEDQSAGLVKLSLLNVVGKEIAELPYSRLAGNLKHLKTDVSGYPKGIYLLKLETEAGTLLKRLVIQ